jgi:hypothetical protein
MNQAGAATFSRLGGCFEYATMVFKMSFGNKVNMNALFFRRIFFFRLVSVLRLRFIVGLVVVVGAVLLLLRTTDDVILSSLVRFDRWIAFCVKSGIARKYGHFFFRKKNERRHRSTTASISPHLEETFKTLS